MASRRPASAALTAAQQGLLMAAADGDYPRFMELVAEVDYGDGCLREVVEAATYKGAGPLHAAAFFGRMPLCVYLVEELQVNVHAMDDSGKRPIDYAAINGHQEIEQYLHHQEKQYALLYIPDDGCNGSLYWEGKHLSAYVNWEDYIPLPSDMVLPNRNWRGTCIGHAYGECLTSRRRIMTLRSKEPANMSGDVSIPWLVHELSVAHCITNLGGKAEDVSNFIAENGAPLEGRADRAYISDYSITRLVNLQKIHVFDMPEDLNSVQFQKVLLQRALLLVEIEKSGLQS